MARVLESQAGGDLVGGMSSSIVVDLGETARRFHALGDEMRLRIVSVLRSGEESVCNLARLLEIGQSRLSFHLKTLKEAGLVRDRRQGRWIYYSVNPGGLEALERSLCWLKGIPPA